MSIIDRLSSSLNRRDEEANIELAKEIVRSNNREAVQVLTEHLINDKKAIQQDCIKVLYEVGERQAGLIADDLETYLTLLSHKNNRLQWGAMTAIQCISRINAAAVYHQINPIMNASESGSIITRDQVVNTLIHLAKIADYYDDVFTLLLTQFKSCPDNQLPMYAERSFHIIKAEEASVMIGILNERLSVIEKKSKRKRIEKVIQKLEKMDSGKNALG